MHPSRPEGGGRPPQAKKPVGPDISEILREPEKEPLTPEQIKRKRRTLAILIILTVLSVTLAVYLTVKAVTMLSAL